MNAEQLKALLMFKSPEVCRDILGEVLVPSRLVACGEPAPDEDNDTWSLSVPDHVARLGFAVREIVLQDPEHVFTPEHEALIREAIGNL